MIKIYLLTDNEDFYYIGKTKNSLLNRLYSHKSYFKNPKLNIQLLDEVEEENWKFWESYWISQFRSWDFLLYNKNDGGGGMKRASLETRIKMGEKKLGNKNMLGKTHSIETKSKISIANKGIKNHLGHKQSEYQKEIVRTFNTGLVKSEKTRKKISLSKKGKKLNISSEGKEKKLQYLTNNKFALGNILTPEQRKKISDSKKGKKQNKNSILKRSISNSKKIIQFDTNLSYIKEWDSITQASSELNIFRGNITKCAKGKIKTCGGFVWRYK